MLHLTTKKHRLSNTISYNRSQSKHLTMKALTMEILRRDWSQHKLLGTLAKNVRDTEIEIVRKTAKYDRNIRSQKRAEKAMKVRRTHQKMREEMKRIALKDRLVIERNEIDRKCVNVHRVFANSGMLTCFVCSARDPTHSKLTNCDKTSAEQKKKDTKT